MKKQIIAFALIAGLTMATSASANWGRGGQGMMDGEGNCPQMQGQKMQQLDPDTQAKVRQFFKDNQALQKQLVMKMAEKQAIMRTDKPDPQAAAKIAGELFDLQTTLHAKAEVAGVDKYLGPMGGGRMGGHGPKAGGGRPGKGGNVAPPPQQ